jgi:FtsH-binding integral membrane protein
MDYEEIDYQSLPHGRQWDVSWAFPVLMRKTYMWMSMALVLTGLSAFVVATNATISSLLFTYHQLIWVLFIAEIALVIGLSAAINRISLAMATLMFVVYAILNGVTFSSLFYVYTLGSLASTFLICAGTFGAMSLVGYFTKSDLSSIG